MGYMCPYCGNDGTESCFVCENGDQFRSKTNGDYIRAMTNEELAKKIVCPEPSCIHLLDDKYTCVKCKLEWLERKRHIDHAERRVIL